MRGTNWGVKGWCPRLTAVLQGVGSGDGRQRQDDAGRPLREFCTTGQKGSENYYEDGKGTFWQYFADSFTCPNATDTVNVDRLIHRIEKALREGAPDPELEDLATEFARYRSIIKARLDKCVLLIHSSKDFAALELAEQPPRVISLMEKLSFANERKWKTLCEEKSLSIGPNWADDHMDLLVSLYNKEVSEDSPIFREYRNAARSRDDDRTFSILKRILRVHPDHPAAKRHFGQLSQKILDGKLDELDTLIREGREQEFLDLMMELEDTDWVIKPKGKKWENALAARASMNRRGRPGSLTTSTKALGSVGMKFIRYLRSLDRVPKWLILVAVTGTILAGTGFFSGFFPALAVALAAYWALFDFKRNP